MKQHLVKGMFAGFIATIALSVVMVLKTIMGMLPNMNAIKMLAGMAHGYLGLPMMPAIGWLFHFLIGSVIWGLLFALLYDRLPGRTATAKGIVFGTLAWVLLMLIVMPMAGAGLFGLHIGIGAPVATLVLHWIYGAVLGSVYSKILAAGPQTSLSHT